MVKNGYVLNAMGEYDNDLSLEIKPDNVDLLKKKTLSLAQLGLLDEARGYFELAKQMKSE